MITLSEENKFRVFTTTMVVATLGLILFIVKLRSDDYKKYEAIRNERIQACKDLNPKYGKLYTTKTGPYEGVKMLAIEFTEVRIMLMIQDSQTKVTFDCSEVKGL